MEINVDVEAVQELAHVARAELMDVPVFRDLADALGEKVSAAEYLDLELIRRRIGRENVSAPDRPLERVGTGVAPDDDRRPKRAEPAAPLRRVDQIVPIALGQRLARPAQV